jgi:ABC-2 type transport system permease protein
MSASETMTESSLRSPAQPVRPYVWSVRRELWENHAIWIAPLAVAAVVIFGGCIAALGTHGGRTVHRTIATASAAAVAAQTPPPAAATTLSQATPDGSVTVQKVIKVQGPPLTPAQRRSMVSIPFYMIAGVMMATMFLVAVFYCLGGLYNERRDRSILFWKSLPVRDLTTVLSKVTVPMVILPAVVLVVALGTQLTLYAIGAMAYASTARADGSPSVPLGDILAITAYGFVILTLWWAPLYAWFLLVSGWAKRAPFLWAVLPPIGLAVGEKIAFGTTHLGGLIQSRLFGAGDAGFIKPQHMIPGTMPEVGISQIDAGKFFTSPGLWLGFLATAGMLAAAVWMRRRREPV